MRNKEEKKRRKKKSSLNSTSLPLLLLPSTISKKTKQLEAENYSLERNK